MVKTDHKIELKSAEIANLWTSYINDTDTLCLLENFLLNVEDQEIRTIIEFAKKLSSDHVQKLTSFFNEEQLPVPDGFSIEADVNKEAPRLFTDDFYIFLIHNIGKISMESYSYTLATSARFDLADYFTECLHESSSLFNKASKLMLSKGIFIRAPYIPKPKMVKYVQKHVEIFGSVLSDDILPSANSWDISSTESTVAPFSDKMMMFNIVALNGLGIGHYGRALGTSPRRDLGAHFTRLISEVALYAEDGTNIMIENGWMEQIPQAPDRDQLAYEEK